MVIGITGGIGSGKSTILNILKYDYNAVIVEMDAVGKKVVQKDTEGFYKIIDAFGENILIDGDINRKALSDIVFKNKEELNKLNQIVHPLVKEYVKNVVENNKDRLVVVESAILFEADYKKECDYVWYIYSSESTRRKRLIESRNYSNDKIDGIFKSQLKENEFRNLSDFTIDNDKDIKYTKKQINMILMK